MKRLLKITAYAALLLTVAAVAFLAGSLGPDFLRNILTENAHARIGSASDGIDFPLLEEAYQIIQTRFVEKIDDKESIQKLEYGSIRGMLKSLDDQYTRFMDPKAYNNMTIETKGKFGGVGIVIGIRNEQLTVISPLEGTPAFEAGIKSGDIILKIDGESTEDMALDDAVARIRGNPGEKVTLTIWRRGFKSFDGKEYELVRGVIELKPINKSYMIEGKKIGYVYLETFSKVSNDELKKSITDFKAKGMEALILDLRNNPGGLLDSAVDVCKLFIDEGPIVHRQDRDGRLKTYYAKEGGGIVNFPVVVLVNQYSASASEIVAGALQDHGVATIMGEQTFGKGLVQTVYKLDDGSAILVTTDKYLTAKKRDINKKGITPDVVVKEDAVDAHETNGEEGGPESGKIGKFPLADLANKNAIIYNGMPMTGIKYFQNKGKTYIEVDDIAKIFEVAVQMDSETGILDIEKDSENLDEKKKDIQLDKAVEYLENKLKKKSGK